MAVDEQFLQFVQDQLAGVEDITFKRMFGGVGIFQKNLMFAKIGGHTLRFKVDATNQQQYIDKGMKPFYSEKKKKGMPYWEVPSEILENSEALTKWAYQSIEIAKKTGK